MLSCLQDVAKHFNFFARVGLCCVNIIETKEMSHTDLGHKVIVISITTKICFRVIERQ